MADVNLPVPIRTYADGDGLVQIKIVDPTTIAQVSEVDTDKNLHVEMHGNQPGGADIVVALDSSGRVRTIVEGSTAGTPTFDYKDATGIAAGSPDNHDYVVPLAQTFSLKQVYASASGKMKIQVETIIGLTTTTLVVGFGTSANPNVVIDFDPAYAQVPASGTVRVIATNKDNQPQDLYTTIIGELA